MLNFKLQKKVNLFFFLVIILLALQTSSQDYLISKNLQSDNKDQICVNALEWYQDNPQLKGECFNLGYSEANLSKRELCEEIKKVIPDFVYLISEIGSDIDKRNYIVSNQKIEDAGFKANRDLSKGIKELVKALPLLKRTQFANI